MNEALREPMFAPPVVAPLQSRQQRSPRAHRPILENRLLAAVSREEYRRLLTRLEPVTLTFGNVLYEPGQKMRHVYFPGDSLVSLLTLVDDHLALEVGMVGCEGMVGIPLALGINVSPFRALVQGSGLAMRMKAAHFRKELHQSLHLQQALFRYTHSLMAQVAQTAACNRFHVVEERLARWLLMAHDRIEGDELPLTHEFLATMLGTARPGVTIATKELERAGLIAHKRGIITILDRKALEKHSKRDSNVESRLVAPHSAMLNRCRLRFSSAAS